MQALLLSRVCIAHTASAKPLQLYRAFTQPLDEDTVPVYCGHQHFKYSLGLVKSSHCSDLFPRMADVSFTAWLASSSLSAKFGSFCSCSCDLKGLARVWLGRSIAAKSTKTNCNDKKIKNLVKHKYYSSRNVLLHMNCKNARLFLLDTGPTSALGGETTLLYGQHFYIHRP